MSKEKTELANKTSREETLLVKKCRRGSQRAQKTLYERFSAKMMGVCYRYTHHQADAEDILQEGFIKVFNSLHQFQFKGSLEGWIRRIMVNTALNFLKQNKKIRHQLEIEEVQEVAIETADMALLEGDILKMMDYLPEGYKTVVNLYAIEGYSHKEIGEMLAISEGTSRSQYSRGKKMLREIKEKVEKVLLENTKEQDQ